MFNIQKLCRFFLSLCVVIFLFSCASSKDHNNDNDGNNDNNNSDDSNKYPERYVYDGIILETSSIELYPSGKIKSGLSTGGGKKWKIENGTEFDFSVYSNHDTPFEFTEDGLLKSGAGMFTINFSASNVNFLHIISLTAFDHDELICEPFILDENQSLVYCKGFSLKTYMTYGHGGYEYFNSIDPDFHKTGMFKKAKYPGTFRGIGKPIPIKFIDKEGKFWNCDHDDDSNITSKIVSFDENGALIPEESECIPWTSEN